ncbi:Ig-like domain-containing protein [Cellulomonas sp. B6]|uniref:Ig-like domain-containing protein n=1 Tax=Cellulomonas sp. B6 TaxID=1295626 RepID=UPI00073C641A|nr:Ig-like domain-containing protein [Cellulomonas sp. B6]KSW18406.1 hypothetical protein ATM99_17465 [Cellulomonas sp. B6]
MTTHTTHRPAHRAWHRVAARTLLPTLAAGAVLVGATAPASAVPDYPLISPVPTTLDVGEQVSFVATCPVVPDVEWNTILWISSGGNGLGTHVGDVHGDLKDYAVSTTFWSAGEQYVDVTCRTQTDKVWSDVAHKRVHFTVGDTAPPVVATTTTTVSATPDRVSPSGQTELRATVSVDLDVTLVGTVQFAVDGTPWAGPVALDRGSAALTVPAGTFAPGTHTLTATFTGDDVTGSTSQTSTFYVKHSPTVVLSLPSHPVEGTVTLTAQIDVTPDQPMPTGQVDFRWSEGARLGTAELSPGGVATLEVDLAAGTYPDVVAVYQGDKSFSDRSSARATLVVDPAEQPRPTPVAPEVSVPSTVTTTVGTPARLTVALPTHHRPTGDVVVRTSGAGDVLLTAPIPATGDLVLTLPVLAPGTHELLIGTLGHKHVASWGQTITVTVTGEPARGSALPDAQLTGSTTTVPASGQITLVARDFEPGETVVFYLHSEPVLLGTAVADAAGVATLVATVPADVASGAHHVVATGGTSQRWAQIAVTVPAATPAATPAPAAAAPAAAPAAPAATALAVTGTGPEMALLTALALVSGIGLLALRRRLATR